MSPFFFGKGRKNIKKAIVNVLDKIEKAGFEAYVVGGYPRDFYLGRELFDIDICTSAKPVDLQKIFPQAILPKKRYGAVVLRYRKLFFEITTFRREKKYRQNRKPCVFEYITDVKEDLLRRDFTINTLCMDKTGKLIDFLGVKHDLDNEIIKTVKEPEFSLEQDSLRVLRAIRFATVLNFTISDDLQAAIKAKSCLLANVSMERKREELDKIFISKNAARGITLLLELNVAPHLSLTNLVDVVIVKNYIGIWAQLDVVGKYPFTRHEKKVIAGIKKVLTTNDFSDYALYYHGLYIVSIAAEIRGYDFEELMTRYTNLPIKERKEIAINSEELEKYCQSGETISQLQTTLEKLIIGRIVINEREHILNYLKQRS